MYRFKRLSDLNIFTDLKKQLRKQRVGMIITMAARGEAYMPMVKAAQIIPTKVSLKGPCMTKRVAPITLP